VQVSAVPGLPGLAVTVALPAASYCGVTAPLELVASLAAS